MANKMSLANKYRPQSFDDVCEQDSIKVVLENQIRKNFDFYATPIKLEFRKRD